MHIHAAELKAGRRRSLAFITRRCGEMSVADAELRKMAEELVREMLKTLDTREGFATIICNIRRKLTKFRRHYSKGRYDKALEEIADLGLHHRHHQTLHACMYKV